MKGIDTSNLQLLRKEEREVREGSRAGRRERYQKEGVGERQGQLGEMRGDEKQKERQHT